MGGGGGGEGYWEEGLAERVTQLAPDAAVELQPRRASFFFPGQEVGKQDEAKCSYIGGGGVGWQRR